MKHVRKSVLLWYSARQMYDLVTQVQAYPEFLPWCDRAEVLEHTDQGMTARLGLAFSGLRHAFTTRNTHEAGRLVTVELVEPVGLAEQAEKEAMVPMELAKPYTLFLGIHF